MVNGATRFGTNPPHFALVHALGDDDLGGESARFELRLLCLLRGVGLVRTNFDILATGDNGAAFLWFAV